MGKVAITEVMIKGFKSFGRRTTIRFSSAITAIVGPNGSGKSNIIDAIEFALGSIKYSELRVKSFQDLLFRGKTKTAEEAVVEIKISADSPYAENGVITIKRKLKKDGTSYFYINGKRATRLRVLDALASINVDVEALNIISQGDIAKFIKLTPKERKRYLEKLSGVELFEIKKKSAEEDLERVNSKLSKLLAMYREKERFLKRAEEDLEKLKKYRELIERKKQAELALKFEERDKLLSKISEFEKQLKELEIKLQELKKIGEAVKIKKEEITAKLSELNRKLIPLEKAIAEKKFRLNMLKEKIRVFESSIRKLEEKKKNLEEEARRLSKAISDLEELEGGLKKELQTLKEVFQGYKEKEEKLAAEYGKKLAEYREALIGYEKKLAEYREAEKKIREIEDKLRFIEGKIEGLRRLKKNLEKRLEEEKELRKKFIESKKKAEERFRRVEEELKNLSAKKEELEKKISSILLDFPPRAVEELRGEGEKTIFDVFGDEELIPLAHIFVELKKPPKAGWAVSVDRKTAEELRKLSKTFKFFGKPPDLQVLGRDEKLKVLKEFNTELRKLEEKIQILRAEKVELQAKIGEKRIFKVKEILEEIKKVEKELSGFEEERKELKAALDKLKLPELPKRPEMPTFPEFTEIKEKIKEIDEKIAEKSEKLQKLAVERERIRAKLPVISEKIKELERELVEKKNELPKLKAVIPEEEKTLEVLKNEKAALEDLALRFRRAFNALESFLAANSGKENKIKVEREKLSVLLGVTLNRLEKLEKELEGKERPRLERPEEALRKIQKAIEALGPINFRAEEDYRKLKEELGGIYEKLQKLEEERKAVINLIEETIQLKEQKFEKFIKEISRSFEELTAKILGAPFTIAVHGDFAYILPKLRENAPGVELLSGGQKVLLSLAFLLAAHRIKPTNFFIFDEVDAPLDKVNTKKLMNFLRSIAETAQIILVTHNDITITEADEIIGVYKEGGVSRVIGLPKERILREKEKWIGKRA